MSGPRASAPTTAMATTPTSRYPACAIDEYASKRLTLSCRSAPRLPTVIVNTASHEQIDAQPLEPYASSVRANAVDTRRISVAKPAALTVVAMNAVTGVG